MFPMNFDPVFGPPLKENNTACLFEIIGDV
jgi:hypothetical protein